MEETVDDDEDSKVSRSIVPAFLVISGFFLSVPIKNPVGENFSTIHTELLKCIRLPLQVESDHVRYADVSRNSLTIIIAIPT